MTTVTTRRSRQRTTAPARAPRRRLSPQALVTRVVISAVLAVMAIGVVYPLLWMLFSALKTNAQLFGNTWSLPAHPNWQNYVTAFQQGIVDYFLNSVIVTVVSVVGVVLIGACAAYALTRLRIPFAQPITLALLGGLMLAPIVALVPLFQLLQTLGLYNTRWALIILYIAYRLAFTTFLIRAYMTTLPREVDEAAQIDGANQWQTFTRVVLPMCRPVLVSAALLQALFAWNEFPFALTFINDSNLKTLPVGLLELQGALTTNWPVLFAGLAIASVPMILVFLAGQRHFIRGLAEGFGK
jgi:raffinose/stachyose/melibiose transport system permease protein